MNSAHKITVTSNKYLVITNPFYKTFDPSSSNPYLEFTIDGVTNSDSVAATDSFTVSIHYTETSDVVNYLNTGMTVRMSASSNLQMTINSLSIETGIKNKIQFVMDT